MKKVCPLVRYFFVKPGDFETLVPSIPAALFTVRDFALSAGKLRLGLPVESRGLCCYGVGKYKKLSHGKIQPHAIFQFAHVFPAYLAFVLQKNANEILS